MKTVRLIIADDHPVLQEGLKKVLEETEGIRVVANATNGRQLIDLLYNNQADMVLLDLHMPKLDGLAALKIIKTQFPFVKVIVFTNYNQPKLIQEIKLLGADGYLSKNNTAAVLKKTILSVVEGNSWFEPLQPEASVSFDRANDFTKKYQLTSREMEIIHKIVQGLTTREIASQLYLSEFTINTHRRNIARKLTIFTPAGLVKFAHENGLV